MDKLMDNKMINKIEKLLQEARTHVTVEVNNTLLGTYMEIGKLLVEDIKLHENEENYQNKTISMLSKELEKVFKQYDNCIIKITIQPIYTRHLHLGKPEQMSFFAL